MTRTGQAATDYARGRIGHGPPPPAGMPDDGLCLQFTRENFAVPARYGSAIDAWNAAAYRHPGDRNPPPHVPVWFRSPSIYDHVCHFAAGNELISTYNDDVFRFDSIQDVEISFGGGPGSYLGWAEDINGVRVWSPDPTPTPEPPLEDDVAHMVKHPNGTVAMVGPGAAFQVLHTPTQMDTVRATGQVVGDLIVLQDTLIWDTAADLARNAGLYTP